MSKFFDKLVEDTKSGELDSIWQSRTPGEYTWVFSQHPFNGMKIHAGSKPISRTKTEPMGIITMPNGMEIDEIDFEKYLSLEIDVIGALKRHNDTIISKYVQTGLVVEEEPEEGSEEEKGEMEVVPRPLTEEELIEMKKKEERQAKKKTKESKK